MGVLRVSLGMPPAGGFPHRGAGAPLAAGPPLRRPRPRTIEGLKDLGLRAAQGVAEVLVRNHRWCLSAATGAPPPPSATRTFVRCRENQPHPLSCPPLVGLDPSLPVHQFVWLGCAPIHHPTLSSPDTLSLLYPPPQPESWPPEANGSPSLYPRSLTSKNLPCSTTCRMGVMLYVHFVCLGSWPQPLYSPS